MERWRRGKVNEVLRIIKVNGACAGQRDNQRIHEKDVGAEEEIKHGLLFRVRSQYYSLLYCKR
jgi:hypothetical protein